MAYTNEMALVNRDILTDKLNLIEKSSSSIIFENSDLFVISPTMQNPYNRFDINLQNIEIARGSLKKKIFILRYKQELLIGDLQNFLQEMTSDDSMYTHKKTKKWQYTVKKDENGYFIRLQGERDSSFRLEKMSEAQLISYVRGVMEQGLDDSTFESEVADLKVKIVASPNLITHIRNYITSQGFNYTEANIKNLYLSLRSKPFVIISGISGTGKTKIVQLFAESIGATEDNGQFTLIPVRPDWSDGSELLGYTDIKGDFIEGPLTKVVREASDHLDRPYFVLLDEMNLARVEYYFSDVLSIMESRKKVGDTYTSSTLITIDEEKLSLPGNVYIIGTVNMDETTHPFSKKVLDRANTIEFNEIYLDSFAFLENAPQIEPVHLANSSIEASYVQIQDCFAGNEQIVKDVSTKLAKINAIIEPLNAHVGYRVRDEICFYMIHNSDGPLFDESKALDYCIMQKILPRLAGSGKKIEKVLEKLFDHFTGDKYESGVDFDKIAALYPLSAKKVYDMLGRLEDEGFTSFWIS